MWFFSLELDVLLDYFGRPATARNVSYLDSLESQIILKACDPLRLMDNRDYVSHMLLNFVRSQCAELLFEIFYLISGEALFNWFLDYAALSVITKTEAKKLKFKNRNFNLLRSSMSNTPLTPKNAAIVIFSKLGP